MVTRPATDSSDISVRVGHVEAGVRELKEIQGQIFERLESIGNAVARITARPSYDILYLTKVAVNFCILGGMFGAAVVFVVKSFSVDQNANVAVLSYKVDELKQKADWRPQVTVNRR